jgi:IS30 family transposase
MDNKDYITISAERKRGQHLGPEERGAIQALAKQGFGVRAIARNIGCSPSTISYELRRGTPPRKSNRGKAPGYSAKRGEAVYKANRKACVKPRKAAGCGRFLAWVVKQMRAHKWSFDACCGYAKQQQLFHADEMVCTRTLYNLAWADLLPIKVTELPEALKRSPRKHKDRENKKRYGTSISQRPEVASLRVEAGHWEGDTVVGKRDGREAVVLSLLEKKTQTYLAFRIPGKTSEAVMEAMRALRDAFGEHFADVFKTITVDNGSEFADFAQVEQWGTKVFFAHPYSSWERAQNERHNGLFRAFVPKGQSIERYTDEDILAFADELNGRPRKKLGYRTPEELFDAFLDSVYAA